MSIPFYIGMAVRHRDDGRSMAIKQFTPLGGVICCWTTPDGKTVAQCFPAAELEPLPLRIQEQWLMAL